MDIVPKSLHEGTFFYRLYMIDKLEELIKSGTLFRNQFLVERIQMRFLHY